MNKILKVSIIIIAFIVCFVVLLSLKSEQSMFSIYGMILLVYLTVKMLLSFLYKPATATPPKLKVAALVSSFNEKGETLLETLKSILAQTYPIAEIYVIDDGSEDPASYQFVKQFVEDNPELCKNVILHRSEVNKGKREQQAWAVKRSNADVFFTVDSDSYVYPDALYELMRTFADKNVYAATGHINARNHKESLLTRLIDIRYDNAFRVERAAQSVTGNILVCSGPLSIYRRKVLVDNLDKYVNQKFMGVVVNVGDDRCLTNYAIRYGKTVYQSTAKCDTDVPSSLGTFLKQQVRWNKSFFRESIESLKLMGMKPIVGIWTILELVLWVFFTISLGLVLFGAASKMDMHILTYAILAVIITSLCRNVHYLVKHPLLFLLSPIYGFIHLLLLFPIRIYALLTIRDKSWGTRKNQK